jgi:hypothetical protein
VNDFDEEPSSTKPAETEEDLGAAKSEGDVTGEGNPLASTETEAVVAPYAKNDHVRYFDKTFEVTLVHPDGALDIQEIDAEGNVARFGKDQQPNWLHRIDAVHVEKV